MRQIIKAIVREVITTIIPAVLLALLINTFVAQAATIKDGPSMEPNLYRGSHLMTEKVSYRLHQPLRGDVVIAEQPGEAVSLIKRVVGLPGETVEVRDGHTFINGEPIDEPWITWFGGPGYPPTQIPPGHVFILGDNRPQSRDSRHIGPVPLEQVTRQAMFVFWPPAQIKRIP